MYQNRIPFGSNTDVVITTTADVADPLKILPVVNNGKLSGNIAFLHDFIKNLGTADAIGRLAGFIGWHHDGNWPLGCLGCRNKLIGVDAVNFSVSMASVPLIPSQGVMKIPSEQIVTAVIEAMIRFG